MVKTSEKATRVVQMRNICLERYLEKFEHGAIFELEEMKYIESINGLGLIDYSFGLDEKGIVHTAKLTPFGLRLMKKHRAMRNPFKRFIYRFLDYFYH